MKRSCFNCKWLSDKFIAACCNSDSENCADYMDKDDSCECWEEGSPPDTYNVGERKI